MLIFETISGDLISRFLNVVSMSKFKRHENVLKKVMNGQKEGERIDSSPNFLIGLIEDLQRIV